MPTSLQPQTSCGHLGAVQYQTEELCIRMVLQAKVRADSGRAPTSSASLKRFSRVHEVGPMVHTILVFLNVLELWESLQRRRSVTTSSDELTHSHQAQGSADKNAAPVGWQA